MVHCLNDKSSGKVYKVSRGLGTQITLVEAVMPQTPAVEGVGIFEYAINHKAALRVFAQIMLDSFNAKRIVEVMITHGIGGLRQIWDVFISLTVSSIVSRRTCPMPGIEVIILAARVVEDRRYSKSLSAPGIIGHQGFAE